MALFFCLRGRSWPDPCRSRKIFPFIHSSQYQDAYQMSSTILNMGYSKDQLKIPAVLEFKF
jgi:hypothetical protein